jgi:hypothetical protein
MNCGGCGIVCSGTKPKCCAGVCRGASAC